MNMLDELNDIVSSKARFVPRSLDRPKDAEGGVRGQRRGLPFTLDQGRLQAQEVLIINAIKVPG
jgi:hypothetical protein